MIKAVIFDKDGVLIDSEDTHVKSTVRAFDDFGIKLSLDERKWIVGRSPVDYMPIFSEKFHLSEEKLSEINTVKKKYYYDLLKKAEIFYPTINLLKTLHSMKFPIALCTQGSKENANITLELIGIKEYFDHIITKDDCSKRKPDPEPYLVSAKKMGTDSENCLVIEDSEVGLKSALAAKMPCIIITNEYTKDQDFTGALKVVDSADKIKLEEVLN